MNSPPTHDLAGTITLDGGILSPLNGNRTISGGLNVAANSGIRLQDFWQNAGGGRTVTLSGTLSGSGDLSTFMGAGPGVTGTAQTGGVLNVNGNLSAYSGTVAAGASTTVNVNTQPAAGMGLGVNGGTLNLRAAKLSGATPGAPGVIAFYYNFGATVNASTNPTDFAAALIFDQPRVFSRVDGTIDIPNGGSGTYPVVPVPGFAFNTNHGAMWKGLLNVTTGGSYQFKAINDDKRRPFHRRRADRHRRRHGDPGERGQRHHTLARRAQPSLINSARATAAVTPRCVTTGRTLRAADVVVGSIAWQPHDRLARAHGHRRPQQFGGGTFDTGVDVTASSSLGAGGTLTLTSGTLSDITVTGPRPSVPPPR